ncbi:MAG TPA: sulfotransferase family protein [Acidimicrobiia bacterium]|nr:sulfotransferase family protein [Acidimicrobiia bacterium]
MRHPIVALWTAPRTASTAFERMMMERGDVTVFHEPFSVRYYFGATKRSARYGEVRDDGDPDAIVAALDAAASQGPVFVKDMAYHVVGLVDDAFLERFVHSFLIRDPAWTVPSLAAIWPDFTDEEVGFDALAALVDRVGDPVIVDSDDLRRDPAGVVEKWCGGVGLPFAPEALSWPPGMRPEWGLWEDWHDEVAQSDGFAPSPDEPPPERSDPRVEAAYQRARPVYEKLLSRG